MSTGMAGGGKTWWPCFCSGLHLLTVLVLEHQSLAHDFVEHEGMQMVKRRKLLSIDLVFSEEGAVVVTDVLLILSQLARLSADYYPLLSNMDMCPALRELLSCANAAVRAKACSAVGNMVRHSDVFYLGMKQALPSAGIVKQLVQLCSDNDEACRKFASFAVGGNSAFHSNVLYHDLAPAIPKLSCLLDDPEEKTRANAAGACSPQSLCGIIRARCPLPSLNALVVASAPAAAGALADSLDDALHPWCLGTWVAATLTQRIDMFFEGVL
eukprot:Skav206496  [mRNA]  locus=scaffold1128:168465:174749:+ [translate_table: standard]